MSMINRRRMLIDGDLPPIFAKFDGGSFMVDETPTETMYINHNLGVKPRGIVIYDRDFKDNVNTYGFEVPYGLAKLIWYANKNAGNYHVQYAAGIKQYMGDDGQSGNSMKIESNAAFGMCVSTDELKITIGNTQTTTILRNIVPNRTYEWFVWA